MQEVGKNSFAKPINYNQTINLIKSRQTQLPIKTSNQQLDKTPAFRQKLAQMGKPRKANIRVETSQVVIEKQIEKEPLHRHQKVAENPVENKPGRNNQKEHGLGTTVAAESAVQE
jgi:hypothetical protein